VSYVDSPKVELIKQLQNVNNQSQIVTGRYMVELLQMKISCPLLLQLVDSKAGYHAHFIWAKVYRLVKTN